MAGNIILYFSTLASAFRFKAPLPPYLPPAEQARQQLVGGSNSSTPLSVTDVTCRCKRSET